MIHLEKSFFPENRDYLRVLHDSMINLKRLKYNERTLTQKDVCTNCTVYNLKDYKLLINLKLNIVVSSYDLILIKQNICSELTQFIMYVLTCAFRSFVGQCYY